MSIEDSEHEAEAVGIWGSRHGSPWDDGIYSTVRQLVIQVRANVIMSIQIEYDKKGDSIWSEKHGGSGPHRDYETCKVKLDYPDEFLISIHGYYGIMSDAPGDIVRSLTFESNKKTYGPFGVEQGTYFSSPKSGGKIVGFHGRSGWYIDAIAFYLTPLQQPNPCKVKKEIQSIEDSEHEAESVGIWGSRHGSPWDDGIYSTVRQLVIQVRANIILSIQIEYDKKGYSIWSEKHGGSGPHRDYETHEVKLDYPDEFLILIHGYYGSMSDAPGDIVQSLTFESNKKTYGPFGVEQGTYFSSPKSGGKIVGFHGRSGWYIDAIAFYLTPLQQPNPCKSIEDSEHKAKSVGIWGSRYGYPWDDGIYSTIRQLVIQVRANVIMSIQIEYDKKGHSIWSKKHGGSGQHRDYETYKVKLDYPDEFLISIHGYHGIMSDAPGDIVRSLIFESNKKTCGPFGAEEGRYFSSPRSGCKIVGFHGRSGWYIDAIGFHLMPLQQPNPCKSIKDSGNKAVSLGTWGSNKGSHWDDGIYSTVRQLVIQVRDDVIESIQIEYDRKGHSIWSKKHGGNGPNEDDETYKVKLDYPDEFLISIHGYYGSLNPGEATYVRSLIFESNKKTYGPFGVQEGKYFSFPMTGGKIVGFRGRSGSCLDAIGVYLKRL